MRGSLTRQGWNGVTYQNQIDNPLLRQVQLGETINSSLVANVAFDGLGGGDLIVRTILLAELYAELTIGR